MVEGEGGGLGPGADVLLSPHEGQVPVDRLIVIGEVAAISPSYLWYVAETECSKSDLKAGKDAQLYLHLWEAFSGGLLVFPVLSIHKRPVAAHGDINFPMKGWRGMVDWARSSEDRVTVPKNIVSTEKTGIVEINVLVFAFIGFPTKQSGAMASDTFISYSHHGLFEDSVSMLAKSTNQQYQLVTITHNFLSRWEMCLCANYC